MTFARVTHGNQYDKSSKQEFRNAIAQMDRINDVSTTLRELSEELDFLNEHGTPQQVVELRMQIAYAALTLESIIQRAQGVLDQTKTVAGDKAMAAAAKPPVFQE